MLHRDGSFWHEGVRVSHPRLHRAFLEGVRFAEPEGVFVVQLGRFRGQLEVEDTPFWVTAYDARTGEVALTDQSTEPLAAASLQVDPDQVLRCTVKGRFPARFTRPAQAHLLDALELRGADLALHAGPALVPVPALATALG